MKQETAMSDNDLLTLADTETDRVQDEAKRPKPKRGQAVVTAAESAPVAISEATQVLQMIERLATTISPDNLERLMAMRDRVMDRSAKTAFDEAMARMQPHLPAIERKGVIEIRKKGTDGERTGPVQQSTKFARWEDINEAIKPIIGEYGFSLRFKTDQAPDGKIIVTGILAHSAGHREETSLVLMHDSTGSKNSVQAIGSTISYGKRYVGSALLNIATYGEDDDAKNGKPLVVGEPITAEQVEAIVEKARAVECPGIRLLARLNANRPNGHPELTDIHDLPAARFDDALDALGLWEATRKDREAKAKS